MNTSVDLANKIDEKHGNRYWQYSIDKGIKNVVVDFDILEHGKINPSICTKYRGHLVFSVKMDITLKA